METKKTIKKPVSKIGTVINCDLLNVRQEPSLDAEILGTLPKDSTLKVKEAIDGWYKIDNGFVKAEFIEIQ